MSADSSRTTSEQPNIAVRARHRALLRFESFFALGRAGRTNENGAPRFLQLVLMAREYDIYDGSAPLWLQKLMFAVLAPLSRALGHRAYFVDPAEREARVLTA
jgi:hypothetical protein